MPIPFANTPVVVVIGGGPGGHEAALSAAQLGAKVTLIERVGVGGSAVLTDVVPSKSLIATADAAVAIREANSLGVQLFVKASDGKALKPEVAVNLAAVNKRLLSLAHEQSEDMRRALLEANVTIVDGYGRLDPDAGVIISTGPDGTDFDRIEATTVILAVGASPRELDSAKPDGERILTWTQLYNMKTLPEHLIVVGSGVTGAEFASAYMNLGSKVTLVSSRDRVLPGEDEDAARVLEDVFKRGGMTVKSKSRAERVERAGDGVVVTLADGKTIEGSHCLMAVGSIPNTAGLGLEEAGVELTDSGHIRVNRVSRTSRPKVYAVGDCTDFFPLASVASMQGRTAAFHSLGDIVIPLDRRKITANIFTTPEIATVGVSEAEVQASGIGAIVQKLSLAENPRAKMLGIKDGFIKLIARRGSGELLGGVVVAPRASELIYPIALAVERRLSADQVSRVFAAYPSITTSITDLTRAIQVVADR